MVLRILSVAPKVGEKAAASHLTPLHAPVGVLPLIEATDLIDLTGKIRRMKADQQWLLIGWEAALDYCPQRWY